MSTAKQTPAVEHALVNHYPSARQAFYTAKQAWLIAYQWTRELARLGRTGQTQPREK